MFALRNQLDREFEGETDRGCAVLTVCLLEETLAGLFAEVLPGGERDAKHFMPRGRLSVGVANAHALGLLDDAVVANFKTIVEIRNIFAHKLLSGISFSSDEVHSKVKTLQLPNFEAAPTAQADIDADPRKRFMMAVDLLFFTLEYMTGQTKPIARAQVPSWSVRLVPVDEKSSK